MWCMSSAHRINSTYSRNQSSFFKYIFDARSYSAPSEAGISKNYCATILSIDHIVQIFELGGLTWALPYFVHYMHRGARPKVCYITVDFATDASQKWCIVLISFPFFRKSILFRKGKKHSHRTIVKRFCYITVNSATTALQNGACTFRCISKQMHNSYIKRLKLWKRYCDKT